MDALEICNKLRSEASGVATSGIPLDVFPQKMQQMILDLARTENYSIVYRYFPYIRYGSSRRQLLLYPD